MPDLKISQLTAATTPLAGTEVLPIVQSSATVKVAVSDLTAGRAVSASSLTASSGNLTFSGTAQRITGDMSNATQASRLAFQSSTANGNTVVHALPNGTSVISSYSSWNAADPTNAAYMRILCSSTDGRLDTGISGTGTYLPMTFFTGNSERMRIDTSGNVGVGTASPAYTLDINATSGTFRVRNATGGNDVAITNIAGPVSLIGSTGATAIAFGTNATERMRIDSSGNVIQNTAAVATNATAGFLWITSCAGAPTGAPTAPYTNAAALVCDTTNTRLYVRVGSTWRYATLT